MIGKQRAREIESKENRKKFFFSKVPGGLVVTQRCSLHRHSNPTTRKTHSLSQNREVSTTRTKTEKNLDHKSLPKKKKKKLIMQICFRDLMLSPLQSRRNRHANGHRRELASLTNTQFLRPSWNQEKKHKLLKKNNKSRSCYYLSIAWL
jgi:hypothetical protein